MNEEQSEAKALNDVNEYGCHVLKVLGGDETPKFAYSIGIEATSKQPDLLVTGLSHDVAHWIINEYNSRVRKGEVFLKNKFYNGFIDSFPVMFSHVLKEFYKEYLGFGLWLYRGDGFRSFQLIYPDLSGQWPWDESASADFKWHMRMLCEPPRLVE
ncbi:DUF4262 domain-containing protein [Nitratireductor soli]|uniref:DUF4262 domain-containing protein n=1 Tax=Nitratireductor soli TaxID=1670619 RepID=UPI00065E860B|nr:DUF4262 domain-containing protein [Nitratireductor soli]